MGNDKYTLSAADKVPCRSNDAQFKQQIDADIESRINTIESDGYDLGQPLNKFDFLCVAIISLVCIVGLILAK